MPSILRLQGSAFYLSGVALVLYGWPMIGILLESYGFFLLFRGFIPTVLGFMRRVPGFGNILDLPGLKSVSQQPERRVDACALSLMQFCHAWSCPEHTALGVLQGFRFHTHVMQVINYVAPAQSAGLPY